MGGASFALVRAVVRGRAWIVAVAVAAALVAVDGGVARADKLVVVEPYAAADVADEGAAVDLLLRSMFEVKGLEVEGFRPPVGRGSTIALSVARLEKKPGWVVISEVARRGSGLRASLRMLDGDGRELGATTVTAGDGDVTALARQAAAFVGPRIKVTPRESPAGSAGSLRAFARLATAPPGEARALLERADRKVTGPVGVTREIASAVWKDEARPADERMEAALAGLATDEAIALADEALAADPKDAHAASIKARALIGRLALDRAAEVLAAHVRSADRAIALARAELDHFRREPGGRDAALLALLGGEPAPAALAFVASLLPGVLSPELEAAALAAAPADDPRLASAIGLRAALGGIDRPRALALIRVDELDDREALLLVELVPESDQSPTAARLRAELAMRRGDAELSDAAVAALVELDPGNPLGHLYRARLLVERGDFAGAAAALEKARELEGAMLERLRALDQAGKSIEAIKLAETLKIEDTVDGKLAVVTDLMAGEKNRDAVALLRQAEAMSPANPRVQQSLAVALDELGQGELAEAARELGAQLAGLEPEPAATGAGLSADAPKPGDGASGAASKLSKTELVIKLPDLLAEFPALPAYRKVLLVPLAGSDAPFWSPRRVYPERLRAALEVALGLPPYGMELAHVVSGAMAEPLSAAELRQLAAASEADGVLLYRADPVGFFLDAGIALIVFDVAKGTADDTKGELSGDFGLVGWNRTFFVWTGALLAFAVGLVVFRLVRGAGELVVKLKLDPEARDEALSLVLSRSADRPDIGDPHTFRSSARAIGHRVRRRRIDLIGPVSRLRGLAPGRYHLHLIGVFDRAGETHVVEPRWSQAVEVTRGHALPVVFDMVPTHAELRLRLYEAGRPATAAEVWLEADPERKLKVDDEGEIRLDLPLGDHVLHIEAPGVTIVRPLSLHAPTIERQSIQLDRERRLQEIAGDANFLDLASADSTPPPPAAPATARNAAPRGVASPAASARTVAAPVAAGSGAPSPRGPAGSAADELTPGAGGPMSKIAVGHSMLGRYDIVKELGRGAMGIVLKARDHNLDRDVALKIISDELRHHPVALQLFMQEAKALAQLNHPNIVAVYDQSQHDGQAFMVMEFVDGTTLEHVLLDRGGKLPVRESLLMLDQIFAGLGYAHDRRVIHRDIKPANIFVSAEGVVKIGDFGLARVMRELSLKKTEIRGTPLYMAPEQITGTNVGPRADLYAAGCTAFELLTGRPPFVDGDILYHHMHSEVPRPSALEPALAPEIDELVMTCIAKDAGQRFESAHAIRERLKALVDKLR